MEHFVASSCLTPHRLGWRLLCAVLFGGSSLFTSCYTALDDEDAPTEVSATGRISVDVRNSSWADGTTRAAVDSTLFPLRYYLFNASKKCLAIQAITDATAATGVTFENLAAGKYSVYVVCGCDRELTAVGKTVTVTTPLLDATSSCDVCLGNRSFTLTDADAAAEDSLTRASESDTVALITTAHVYAQMQMRLSAVPSDVKAITATLEPIYQSISWNGKGTNASNTTSVARSFALTPDAEGCWSTECVYLPPSAGNVTVTLQLTDRQDSVTTRTSTAGSALKSGVQLSLTSTYDQMMGATVGFGLIIPEWSYATEELEFSAY